MPSDIMEFYEQNNIEVGRLVVILGEHMHQA